jgi:hypothetical protein
VKWTTLLLVVLVAGAAGCGGGGSSGQRLTRAEFIAKGDVICTKYKNKNQALNQNAPVKNPTDPSATDAQVKASAPLLEQLADNLRSARAEFAKLNPPADTESDWNNTLDDLDQLASKLDTAAQSARALDRQRVVNEYGGILRLNHRISTFEQDYGFKVCGAQG